MDDTVIGFDKFVTASNRRRQKQGLPRTSIMEEWMKQHSLLPPEEQLKRELAAMMQMPIEMLLELADLSRPLPERHATVLGVLEARMELDSKEHGDQ